MTMSARLVLHIVTTIILFAIGWWLYIRMTDSANDALDATRVATYWFASLVFIFFSWIFYWFVHKLKLKAWIIALLVAVVIAAASTVALQMAAEENQRNLEEAEMQKQSEQKQETPETVQSEKSNDSLQESLETLNLGEE